VQRDVATDGIEVDVREDAAAQERCALGPIVTVHRRLEPSFVLSLAAVRAGGFVYTRASGWSGFTRPELVLIDAALVERQVLSLSRLDTVHAVDGESRLYSVTSDREPMRGTIIEHGWITVGDRLQRTSLGALCEDGCVAIDRPIAVREGSIGVAVATQRLDSGGVQIVDRASGSVGPRGIATDLRAPALLAVRDGWYAVARRADGALARVVFDPSATAARALAPVLDGFNGSEGPAVVRAAAREVVVVGSRAASGGRGAITMATWAGDERLVEQPSTVATIAATGVSAQGLSVAARPDRGWVAVAWGEQIGLDRSGAWLTVQSTDGSELFSAKLASEPVGMSQSYTVYTALAPHPEGFLLLFNGWQRAANYGIYGRVVRCR
jgi:hypothetical protein